MAKLTGHCAWPLCLEWRRIQRETQPDLLRRSGSDNGSGSCPRRRPACLQAQSPQHRPLSLQILQGVLNPDFVRPKKRIDLLTGRKAEKAPQVGLMQPPLPVLFRRQGLPCPARNIPPPALSRSATSSGISMFKYMIRSRCPAFTLSDQRVVAMYGVTYGHAITGNALSRAAEYRANCSRASARSA